MLSNECVHNDDLGRIIGYFHGIPVREWDAKATRVREITDVKRRIKERQLADADRAEAGETAYQYVVPEHEVVDAHGIIRPKAQLNKESTDEALHIQHAASRGKTVEFAKPKPKAIAAAA
jgi:hypothetical protein